MNPTYIQTFSGRRVDIFDPSTWQFQIIDIAHALSNLCRFTGHTKRFYSVAEHSIHVSTLVPEHLKLVAMLHDASEAYLADIPRPIKQHGSFYSYRQIERDLTTMILKQWTWFTELPKQVHDADMAVLSIEAKILMGNCHDWPGIMQDTSGVDININCWTPEQARKKFLTRFAELESVTR